jgi:hypothetical protein
MSIKRLIQDPDDPGDIAHVFKYEYDGCVHRFLVEDEFLDFDLCLYGERDGEKYKKIVKIKGNITEEDLMDYKINDGIRWVSPRRFSERRKAVKNSKSGHPTRK